ncbi:uncharacterized protein LOC111251195 isoform X2 [Varroa destructor]|uniref:Secreted protein n=1 Tax=Varroa destructor TaxID=109461 RepID=A0A7M7KGN1_VARDE|nr:uncharacterized protein LOC111251195 isoform X2 [Varroa destructor]
MLVFATHRWMALAVTFLFIGSCHGILKRLCDITSDQARQMVIRCARQNLADDIRRTFELRFPELGTTEMDPVNRICEEFSRDPNYKLTFANAQRVVSVISSHGMLCQHV